MSEVSPVTGPTRAFAARVELQVGPGEVGLDPFDQRQRLRAVSPASCVENTALFRADEETVRLTTWQNALDAYAQSGQIDVEELLKAPAIDQTQLFQDNSVLRGQEPRVEAPVPN